MSFRSSVTTALNKLAKLYLTIRQTPPIKTTDNITAPPQVEVVAQISK